MKRSTTTRTGQHRRTVDLFEADTHGFLWLVGRLKDMIRRSSENISAREVETGVRELPEVEVCAAVPVPEVKRGAEVKVCVQLNVNRPQSLIPLWSAPLSVDTIRPQFSG